MSARARRFHAPAYPETYARDFRSIRHLRLVDDRSRRELDPELWWALTHEDEQRVMAFLEAHPERDQAAREFRKCVTALLEIGMPEEILGLNLVDAIKLVREIVPRAAGGSGENAHRYLVDGVAVLRSALDAAEPPHDRGWVEVTDHVTEWHLLPADERAIHRLKLADRPWRCLTWILANALRVTLPPRPRGREIIAAAVRVVPRGLWPDGALEELPDLIDRTNLTLSRGGGRARSVDAAVEEWRRMFGEVPLPELVFRLIDANPGVFGSVKQLAKELRRNETEVAKAIKSLGSRVVRRRGRRWWPAT